MQMHDDIAHMGVVDGRLGLGLPSALRAGVIREYPDDVEFCRVAELVPVQLFEFAAKYRCKSSLD